MLVFTNGCFDILHAGHVAYLEQSRALGKYLVVGLNSDASVRRLKGGTRPINSQEDRKRVLLALRAVDACSREGLGSRADLVGRGRVLWEGLGL
jgi:rfaE bifunctional protein nucleotidyltransferase chain/domain